ncbi:MAG TPA: MarR family transcriptional regulator [Acidimicrobiia bacterium]|nr:MarR family transcriptional regulator [Acidimicrobiia bacterium]
MTRQDLVARLGAAMQSYQRANDAFDDVVAAKLGVNRTDLRCLDWLADGSMTVGALSKAIGISSAATTTMVDRLEKHGYVERLPDAEDRRRTRVVATDRLGERAARIYGPLVAAGNEITTPLDVATLEAICEFIERSREVTDRHRGILSTLDLDG